MNATRSQGLLFATAALLLSGYHASIGLPGGTNTLYSLVALIVLLGVPHGTLDTLYAGRVFGIRRPLSWFLFTLAYLLPIVVVMLLWPHWPAFLLLLFLIVSTLHFSGDPAPPCPRWLRIVYGGSPVVVPTMLHGGEVEQLFAALVPASIAADFAEVLSILAWPWLIALALGAVKLAVNHRLSALEIAAAGILFVLVPPLVSFTLFFCGMHSARHILRSVGGAEAALSPPAYLGGWAALVGLPLLATFAILAVYWKSAGHVPVEPRLLQTVFISLAALTFPHVILVDCFYRFRPPAPPATVASRTIARTSSHRRKSGSAWVR